ncbi:Xylose isomerase domain protein TIM barrel [Methanosalsum zhilinae DSM 4017]|uniref:Xylose isomerase domain protein TIM barrel n=1 Tax=Methanosalsum zhilinae (strain DSM 4017 / NBRC 107636 / OCM 62 / WeN5) TaxID=679901 RepID=F7XKR6_METZD|nr:sugar phosphate isomerase/epimerase family protein [Methanosalsum zhilinae]AEH61779.1 Xylose isomerase domain protein TIM barrel [Methanosalsum zhilinae DSM 4017]
MIGISTYAYRQFPLYQALETIEGKVQCAEIFSEGPHDILKDTETPLSFNLKYAVHAPCTDLNIACIREPIRKASVELVGQMLDACQRIDADVMVLHPGYFTYSIDVEQALDSLSRSLEEMESFTQETGVKICIENMPADWNCFVFQQPDLDLKAHHLALDIGHAATTGRLNEFLEMPVSHFHVHDNNGLSDEHLPVGSGSIDFKAIASALRNNRAMKILEHHSDNDVMLSLESIENEGMVLA